MRPPFGFWCVLLFACATANPLPADPARLRLDKTPESDWPAAVGTVEFWPTLPDAFGLTTPDGKPVPFATVWKAPGEPSLIRFDVSSGATTYYLVLDTNAVATPGNWQPAAGVLLETRACQEAPVDTRAQVNRLVNAAGPVYGRGFVPAVFLGMNPYGPSAYYVALFSGWFNASRPGDYSFATVSGEASSLQVDGRLVTEWLGRHGPHAGRHGEHSGRIVLKAGPHHLEYVQIQFAGESAAVAAWKPPGTDRFEVIPASAFLPVARFQATRFAPATGASPQLYFEWQNADHCQLGQTLLVRTRFRVVDPGQDRTYQWRFDDGERQTGASVQHFFPQAGLRQVCLEAWSGGSCIASNTVQLRVMPHWLQREDYRQDVFDDCKQDFLRRDLAHTPPRDLDAILDLAQAADDQPLLDRAAEAFLNRADEFTTSVYGNTFYLVGLRLQHQGDWGDRLAEKALRLASTPARSPGFLNDKARLRLADLLIHCVGEFSEAQKLLGQAPGNGLSADERRLWRLLHGDLALARGKTDEARQLYLAVGDAPNAPAGRFGLGRAAVLESAQIMLQRGDLDQAQRTLDRLAFEVPLQRLMPAAALLRLQLNLKRKEFQRAFIGSQTLLRAQAAGDQTAEVLGISVESALALGKTEDARRDLRRLLKEFPYSDAAAKAKDRWATTLKG